MILVIGGANRIGRLVCRRLRESGLGVRALLPPQAGAGAAEALRSVGAQLLLGDLASPAALAGACHDIEAVVDTEGAMLPTHPGAMQDSLAARSLVEFAHAMGVGRFVYITVPESFRHPCPLLDTRRELCDRLARRHRNHTILCANFFMETWLGPEHGFDYLSGSAVLYGNGSRPIAWVSCSDVAEMAIAALSRDDLRGRCLSVDGPREIAPMAVVQMFEQSTCRRFQVTCVPNTALEAEHRAATDPIVRSLAALRLEYARGCPAGERDVSGYLPRPLTTLEDYIGSVVGSVARA